MTLTTAPTIEGWPARDHCGIVTGDGIHVTAMPVELVGGMRDWLASARQEALDELQAAARQAGANAIIGIDLDYEVVSDCNMVIMSAKGTAVII